MQVWADGQPQRWSGELDWEELGCKKEGGGTSLYLGRLNSSGLSLSCKIRLKEKTRPAPSFELMLFLFE